jgi:hypothetical protein
VLRDELADLWSDLSDARGKAANREWSMQCDWLTGRIVRLSRLTGATPWKKIPCDLLLDGIYTGIMDQAGVPFDRPDLDEVAKLAARRQPSVPGGAPG